MTRATHDLERLARAFADDYVVERCAGVGATAAVYRARDRQHARTVAIKVLLHDIAGSIEQKRFLREIQIVSQLSHPHVLPLLASGERDGFVYYVMPFVEESLRDRLTRDKFLSVDDALRFTAEIADALDFAHARGVIHRDIKPENILLQADHAVVADFGISKALDDSLVERAALATGEMIAVGTPVYMSPEQAAGDGVDGRSDLYALACTTYEMLAGTPPFTGATAQSILARKIHGQMPPLRTVRPTTPPSVERSITQALSIVPADRFATAGAFVAGLRQRPVTRKPARLWLGIAVAIVAIATAILLRRRMQPAPPEMVGTSARVAVFNFANLTNGAAPNDVGFMALDAITEGLQRLATLHVIPMPSALAAITIIRAGAADTSARVIEAFSREIGATAVVSGNYYRRGDSIVVYAIATDATKRNTLFSVRVTAPFDRPELAVDQVRTRLMGYFATSLDERIPDQGQSRSNPPTYEAYRAFSEGMSAYTLGQYKEATDAFRDAIAKDSTFALPRLFLSISLSNQQREAEADSVAHGLAAMRDHLNRFYQDWLDYRLAFLAGDRPKALEFARQLATQAPGTRATYSLAVEAQENGRPNEALRAALSLPPDRGPMRDWLPYWDVIGTSYHLLDRFDQELDAGARERDMYRSRQYALLPSIRASAALGRMTLLSDLLTRAERLPDEPRASTLGKLYEEAALELRAHGRQAAAAPLFAKASEWYRKRAQSQGGSFQDSLLAASALYEQGDLTSAERLVPSDTMNAEVSGLAGLIAVRRERPAQARAILARLNADRRPYQRGAPELASARISALLGDTDAAVSSVRAALDAGREYSLWLHRTGEFASLRSNPQFAALLKPKP